MNEGQGAASLRGIVISHKAQHFGDVPVAPIATKSFPFLLEFNKPTPNTAKPVESAYDF